MENPRLAARYAKSLIDIAQEKQALEAIRTDIVLLAACVNQSKELKQLLRSPVVKADKKKATLNALFQSRVHHITLAFLNLLVAKGREKVLPEIVHAFVDAYNEIMGIRKVKVTTALPLSAELKATLLKKYSSQIGFDNIELTEVIDEQIIGGFILEYDNKIVDASIQSDLRNIKRQFMRNDYLYSIR